MRCLITSLLFLIWLLPLHAGAEGEVIAIIIPKAESVKVTSKPELALIFWRKKLYWASSKRIQPVNLSPDNVLRQKFSLQILDSPPEDQLEYWNALYFHGTPPPHVVRSQEAMLRYVADTPGAIGYVDACRADSRVKAVAWLLTDGSVSHVQPSLGC
ncbi:substrate-binding domain-containing protein [Methylobacillus gramineus]|uniref:substrate-binding domain-containing protein n=1 Tax=Methylobacillus gramineus TaxID=755169 RepID=UPI001D000A58|nr:substrate-binding domain-containing protein [Methylobacillus gramineus]MCB5185910.1 substrate-binding domain-containing protein [Methylobacillus gramineus]